MISDKEHKNAMKNYLRARKMLDMLVNEEPPEDVCPWCNWVNDWEQNHAEDVLDACIDVRDYLGNMIARLIEDYEEVDKIMRANAYVPTQRQI